MISAISTIKKAENLSLPKNLSEPTKALAGVRPLNTEPTSDVIYILFYHYIAYLQPGILYIRDSKKFIAR